MSADFVIKRNDTGPSITATLTYATGDAINLTGASVRFHLVAAAGSAAAVDAAAAVVDAAAGQVRYDWQAADTATSGSYEAEWEVTLSTGVVVTAPNTHHLTVEIAEDLA